MQQFYGGEPEGWFNLPIRYLNAYTAMLPRLRAEESIRRVQELQLASGAMDKEDAGRTWQGWIDAANPEEAEEAEQEQKMVDAWNV